MFITKANNEIIIQIIECVCCNYDEYSFENEFIYFFVFPTWKRLLYLRNRMRDVRYTEK